MKKYSQNNEDQIIAEYFGIGKINVLSIGENDGKTLSNVLRSIEEGASGLLIEPSPVAYERMRELHKDNDKVQMLNVAIGLHDHTADFYESGEHLGTGDIALLSTLHANEVDRWKSSGEKFNKTKTEVISFASLMELSPLKTFDLISIDTEGADIDILRQMDLTSLKCRMLIIEVNQRVEDQNEAIRLCEAHGLKLVHKNYENFIFVK